MKKFLVLFLAVFAQANLALACEHKEHATKAPISSGSSEECDQEETACVDSCEA
jgi:hypothetical protein